MHTEGRQQGRQQRRDPAQSTSAIGTELPHRARELWSNMLEACDTQLQTPIRHALDATCAELFRLADRSFNNADQQSMLASKREIQRAGARVASRVLSGLGQTPSAADATQSPVDTGNADAFGALELVDPQQFEESVLLDDITARLNSRSSLPLLELGYRVGLLQASPMLNADDLPFGPRAIIQAFRSATADFDLRSRDRQLLFRQLEQHLGPVLRTMYEDINTQLVAQRILPNLHIAKARRTDAQASDRAQPLQDASSEETTMGEDEPDISAESADSAPGETPAIASAPQRPRNAQNDANYTAMFDVLSDMLAKQREALATPPPAGAARQVPEPRVLDALKDLQLQVPSARTVDGGAAPRTMQDLRQDLMQQLRDPADGNTPLRLSSAQRDTIDLVSMLFDQLGGELQPGGSTQSLLMRMQVPMLRAAMTDHSFFSQREHPARRLMNSLIEAANQWLDQSEPDPALSKHLRALTHRIANEYDGDNRIFDEIRQDIDEYIGTLAHRAKMAEKRHVEAVRGRERLDVARSRARALVDARVADGAAPELVNALLEQAWTDVLSLTILRSGERSEAFRRRMRVTDQLLRFTAHSASQEERTELRAEITSGLGQVGIHSEEASDLAKRVTPDAAPEPDADKSQEDTALAKRLRQRQSIAREIREPVSRSPGSKPLNKDEQAALDRILQLPFGSFLLVKYGTAHPVRQKLAWYSPRTGRCLMLNQRGSRCDETSINDLARGVANGRIRLPGDKPESLLDRAWKSILETLKQFPRQAGNNFIDAPEAP